MCRWQRIKNYGDLKKKVHYVDRVHYVVPPPVILNFSAPGLENDTSRWFKTLGGGSSDGFLMRTVTFMSSRDIATTENFSSLCLRASFMYFVSVVGGVVLTRSSGLVLLSRLSLKMVLLRSWYAGQSRMKCFSSSGTPWSHVVHILSSLSGLFIRYRPRSISSGWSEHRNLDIRWRSSKLGRFKYIGCSNESLHLE